MSGSPRRRERNPFAQTLVEAARDRLLERRRRLAAIAGRRPRPADLDELDRVVDLTAKLAPQAAQRLADLAPTVARMGEAYAAAARRMADTIGMTSREAQENLAAAAAAMGAAAPRAVRDAWELGELVERARLAGVDVDAVLEAARRHPMIPREALERAIAARTAAPAPLPIITTAADLARLQRLRAIRGDDPPAR
jgi:hypothetical protein